MLKITTSQNHNINNLNIDKNIYNRYICHAIKLRVSRKKLSYLTTKTMMVLISDLEKVILFPQTNK